MSHQEMTGEGAPDSPGADAPRLDYRSALAGEPRRPGHVALNWFGGFCLWVAGLITMFAATQPIARLINSTGLPLAWGIGSGRVIVGTAVAELIVLLTLAGWIRVRFRLRGLLPGLFLGMLLTCLVPVGIVAVVCGPWNRR